MDIDLDADIGVEVDVDIDGCFWLFKRGFKVSSGTVQWCTSSSGTDFDDSEMASLEAQSPFWGVGSSRILCLCLHLCLYLYQYLDPYLYIYIGIYAYV